MLDYLRLVRLPLHGERGASAAEYALLISGIAALLVLIVYAFGDNVVDMFSGTCDSVNQAEAGCATD